MILFLDAVALISWMPTENSIIWDELKGYSEYVPGLNHFFPMLPFDPPENIKKTTPRKHQKIKVFLMFSEGTKGNIGKKWFN